MPKPATGLDARKINSIRKQIEKHKNVIAKERDALRDLINEIDSLEEDCREAVDSLEYAADALSRLV
jgi:septal ring factor EnvC (AmiA/AmiB activator)